MAKTTHPLPGVEPKRYRHVGNQELIPDASGKWMRVETHEAEIEELLDEHEETYRAQAAQIARARRRADKWESAYKDRTRELDFATERVAQLVSHMAAVLNRALEADRMAVESLFRFRVACNEELADDPTIVVRDRDGKFSVALLGVINGLLVGDDVIFMEVEYPSPHEPLTIKEFKVAHKAQFQEGYREVSGECPVCGGDEYLQPCPKCGGLEP